MTGMKMRTYRFIVSKEALDAAGVRGSKFITKTDPHYLFIATISDYAEIVSTTMLSIKKSDVKHLGYQGVYVYDDSRPLYRGFADLIQQHIESDELRHIELLESLWSPLDEDARAKELVHNGAGAYNK
jgi:hypothetical protein